ncbi:MAG: fibronectin type III domain-containing protein, partial [Candidatus Nanopelagicales bacterium]
MSRLPRGIFTWTWRANNRARARVAGRTLRPLTSTLASVSLVLGALAGSVVASSPATAADPSCAAGGSCVLGDTGPGGGLVFFISDGVAYEMAPNTWTGTSSDDTPGQKFCVRIYAQLTNTYSMSGAAATAHLLGYCSGGAPVAATAYSGGGLTDWYLPNLPEMNSMCNYSRTWSGSPSTSSCAGSQDATFASSNYGFTNDYYWTSRRYNNKLYAWSFSDVTYSVSISETTLQRVRPIRSFALPVVTQTVAWAPTTSITTSTTTPSVLATTDGNGVISYAVTNAGETGCTVDPSTAAVTFTGAGSCQITASATETTTYTAASTAVTFTVALTPQTITVSAGTTTPVLFSSTDLSTSGVVGTGAITYNVASGTSNCSIANSTLTGAAVGPCTVTSSVAADSFYAAATSSAITLTVQKAPQSVTWAPSNTSLSFSDSPVTPSEGATSAGDGAITYSVTNAGTTSCLVDSATGTLTYSATGTCVVRATAASSTDYDSGTTDISFTITAVAPTQPTITSASAGNTTATVAFTAPSSDGGATITGYTATASPGGATGTCSSSPCTVNGLTIGVSYTITLTATNSAGTSVASLASPPVIPATSPDAVENLSVVPGNAELAVSWVEPACIALNTCGTLTGYEVFTSTNNGSSWIQFGTSDTAINKTVDGLVNGTQYDVKVRVTTSTSFKDALAQQVPATTPSAPTGVTVARLTATTASVGWAAPSSDGGQPVTGYT